MSVFLVLFSVYQCVKLLCRKAVFECFLKFKGSQEKAQNFLTNENKESSSNGYNAVPVPLVYIIGLAQGRQKSSFSNNLIYVMILAILPMLADI